MNTSRCDSAHTPRDTANTPRDTAHISRDTAHMSRDTAHMSRDTAHTSYDSAHMSRDTAHTSYDSAHISRDTAHTSYDSASTHDDSAHTLRYAARLERCAVLGPGNRAVLWTFGCPFSCKGCIAERFKTGPSVRTTPQECAVWYLRQNADGLTISGGEPMLQAGALCEMIDHIRAERDCGVIVYTGFVYEELLKRHDADVARFLRHIDLLIDGPYIQELDENQPYRGSENQRFLLLTERYREALETYYNAAHSRQIELHFSERRTMMAGVPGREQADIWGKIKELGERNGGFGEQ